MAADRRRLRDRRQIDRRADGGVYDRRGIGGKSFSLAIVDLQIGGRSAFTAIGGNGALIVTMTQIGGKIWRQSLMRSAQRSSTKE
jgi:hypothetical protein